MLVPLCFILDGNSCCKLVWQSRCTGLVTVSTCRFVIVVLSGLALGDLKHLKPSAAASESPSKKAVPHGLIETLQPCHEFILQHANVCVRA